MVSKKTKSNAFLVTIIFLLIMAMTLTFASCDGGHDSDDNSEGETQGNFETENISQTEEETTGEVDTSNIDTEAPTEVITEESTESPTEEPTDEPTEAPTEGETEKECKHTLQNTIPGKSATCTEEGLTAGSYCIKCNKIIKEQTTIPKLGHRYEDGNAQFCSRCGYERFINWASMVQYINGLGANGTGTSYKAISYRTRGSAVYIDCTGITFDGSISIEGYILVHGHEVKKYVYSFDGKSWLDCTTITYSGLMAYEINTMSDYGVDKGDKKDNSKFKDMQIDLSDYRGRTIDKIIIGAVIDDADESVLQMCHFENVNVKHEETSTTPGLPGILWSKYSGYNSHSFDYTLISGEDVGNYADCYDVVCGDVIKLGGWIGFKTSMKRFGYIIDDGGIENILSYSDYMAGAEEGVLAAGGQYAKRFYISADATLLSDGEHTIYFVAELDNGTVIVMKSMKVKVTGGFDAEEKPDGAVVEAQPDKSSPSNTQATVSGSSVETGLGLTYTYTGGSFGNNRFAFSGSVAHTVTFDGNFSGEFNRFKLRYVSTQPIKAVLTYTENGESITDTVYLEASDVGTTFTCLTKSYLDGVMAGNLSKIEFYSANGKSTNFLLCNVEVEKYTVYNSNIKFLQNSEYRLGIKLAWGGGICYIEDRQDGISDLYNLINLYDAGRLVQQSYYGTKGNDGSGYTPGNYNGTEWRYNPVQGGDLHGNHSRIIDIVVEDYSVYIKAQPQDWGQDGKITASYMENVYTLYKDRIDVWNRFVDYSGYNNPEAYQELPAFYTVGYLDTFYYANESNPWGKPLINSNLYFWGVHDTNRFSKQYYKQTDYVWSAFTNSDGSFGIGLYTPNAGGILAGRCGYDDNPRNHGAAEGTVVQGCGPTKNPYSFGCSYIAPNSRFKVVSYQAVEYSYIMTTGSISQIESTFSQYRDFASNSSIEHIPENP